MPWPSIEKCASKSLVVVPSAVRPAGMPGAAVGNCRMIQWSNDMIAAGPHSACSCGGDRLHQAIVMARNAL